MKQIVIILAIGPCLSLLMGMGSKPASGTASSEDSSTLPRVSSRARGQALQTDKFPRPPERAVSETTQPKPKE